MLVLRASGHVIDVGGLVLSRPPPTHTRDQTSLHKPFSFSLLLWDVNRGRNSRVHVN